MTLRPVAVVSGAARGIGAAVARHLAADGWRLALVDRDGEALRAAAERLIAARATTEPSTTVRLTEDRGAAGEPAVPSTDGGVRTYVLDVADEHAVAGLARDVSAAYGGADAVVNNAGIGGTGTRLEDVTLDRWEEMLRIDLTSVFLMCRAFLPALRASSRGRVVNLGSVSAQMGVAGSTAYAAAKGGVEAFSRSLARELAADGVTVNVIAPGVIDTDMARRRGIDHQRHLIPLPRIGTPDDVAAAVTYLLSEGAGFVTGHVLAVNGGAHMA